jgi:hypothetical protein
VQHHVAVVPHERHGPGNGTGIDRRADDCGGELHVAGSAGLSRT